jgi:hypothetical protein
MSAEERRYAKSFRAPQYNYMKPPGMMHDFQVVTQWKCIAIMKEPRFARYGSAHCCPGG